MKKNKSILNIISIVLVLICFGMLLVFSYYIYKLNIIPNKYLLTGYGLLLLILTALLYIIFCKKNPVFQGISLTVIILMSFGLGYLIYYLNSTYHFLNQTQRKYDTLSYSVFVLKETQIGELNDLNEKNISYMEDTYSVDINQKLSSKISYNEHLTTELGVLPDQLLNRETDAIVLEASSIPLIEEEIEEFSNSTKVIYTFEISIKAHVEETKPNMDIDGSMDIELSNQSFILYISGIDQFGNVNSVRGRSDVNQIVVVNPSTHHILLVNTPRDYYVQLAGTTGLKDKLTHAGIYGIEKSIATLENFYDIDINYYLRVNFNTLIQIVDVIGGIDVESDSSFTCHTKGRVKVQKGWNHFNGEQALAYSRERKAYLTGDHHRGANQQQVITAIINKVTKSHVLISKYNSILNTLNGSFQTDMPMDKITSLIKNQLDKMPSWTVESMAVTGYNSRNYTYSMGTNYWLYVMEPDYDSVNVAKKRMQEVFNES